MKGVGVRRFSLYESSKSRGLAEYQADFKACKENKQKFWGDVANKYLSFDTPFNKTFAGNCPLEWWYF